jgi:hypothetical protein
MNNKGVVVSVPRSDPGYMREWQLADYRKGF